MDFLLGLSGLAAGSLVASVWEGAVLAVGVWVCLRMLPGIPAAVRSVVWMAVFGLVGLLDLCSLPVRTATAGAVHVDARWSVAVAALWGGLSLVRAVRLIAGAVRLRRLAGRAVPVIGDAVVAGLLRDLGGRREAELCVSGEVTRPSVVGFFAPRILLPEGLLERLSAAELEQVVLHEVEHLRRGDDWTNLLQKIGLVAMPLNPVLLWVERRVCVERELACDDSVMGRTGARKSYAACLVNLAEHAAAGRQVALALGALAGRSELARRVDRILRTPEARMGRQRAMAAAGLVMAGLLVGAGLLAGSPELVSFAPATVAEGPAAPAMVAPAAGMMRDVVYRPGASVGMVPAGMHSAPVAKATVRRVARVQGVRRRRRVAMRPGWVVLTGWNGAVAPTLLRFAVADETSSSYAAIPSYAAVPTASGWLVFQL